MEPDTSESADIAKSPEVTPKVEEKKRDTWDKLDIILKFIGALGTAAVVGLVGFYGSNWLAQRQEAETNLRLYTELMSKREESDTSLRKEMFNSIITNFLKPASDEHPDEAVLNLELLAYNFHDSLDLGPLFKDVKRKLDKAPRKNKAYLDRLIDVTKDVTAKQVAMLQEAGGKRDGTIVFANLPTNGPPAENGMPVKTRTPTKTGTPVKTATPVETETPVETATPVETGTSAEDGTPAEDGTLAEDETRVEDKAIVMNKLITLPSTNQSGRGNPTEKRVSIRVLNIDRKKEEVRVHLIITNAAGDYEVDEEFTVDYFDFPMLDNVRLPGGYRCAVVLNSFEKEKAEFTFVYFPSDRAGIKEKPYYDEIRRNLRPESR
jgi:hypothetical protein